MDAPLSGPRSTQEEGRIILGFALQPIVAAALGAAAFPLIDYLTHVPGHVRVGQTPLEAALAFGLYSGVAALIITVFCALPLFLLFLKRGVVTPVSTITCGVFLGNVPTVLLVLNPSGAGPDVAVRLISIGSFLGAAGACAFWLIARKSVRPAPEQFADSSPFVV